MSSNKLTGNIPNFTADAPLRGLYLSDNDFQGEIPTSICGLEHLEALFLDENSLGGSIPPCLGDLAKLKQLYLFKNQLTGGVPVQLGNLKEIGTWRWCWKGLACCCTLTPFCVDRWHWH